MTKKTEKIRISKELIDVIDRRREEFGLSRPDMSRIIALEVQSFPSEIELVRRRGSRSKLRVGGKDEKKFRLV